MDQALILLQLVTTLCLTGLIWFVQLVHYPQFAQVGAASFSAYEAGHQRRTSRIVVPLMTGELFAAALLLWQQMEGWSGLSVRIGGVLLMLIWASTFLLQVPCHRRLGRGFDPVVLRRLVSTNWIRTLAWTARAALATSLVATRLAS